MNKKGFTLVEVLAIVIILAVVLVIAVPKIMNTIRSARIKIVESSAKIIAKKAEEDYYHKKLLDKNYHVDSISCSEIAEISNEYGVCTILYDSNGVATVTLEGADNKKLAGIVCNGTKDNMNCLYLNASGNAVPEYNCTFDGE